MNKQKTYDMPRVIGEYYEIWMNNFPESFHPCDLERFYRFVGMVIRHSKKRRGSDWLRKNLEENRRLEKEDVERYCEMYETILEFYEELIGLSNHDALLKSRRKNTINYSKAFCTSASDS